MSKETIGILDTSAQIDRIKSPHWRKHIEEAMKEFDASASSGISLLEFKAVLIQQCITIHNALKRDGRYTAVRDSMIESAHPQSRLRAHIFNNILNVYARNTVFETSEDLRLGEKARLLLETHIPQLYRWFREQSADYHLDAIKCNRAAEAPVKKQAAFGANLPICKRGKNKSCCVEDFIRSNAEPLIAKLRVHELSPQLQKAIEAVESICNTKDVELTSDDCRGMGDFLIITEAIRCNHITHSLSTNVKDWQPLSECVDVELVTLAHQQLIKQSANHVHEA